tara:strand:+ start:237 stop:1430 length:1194 start_codon:yes stop_codon:yes gene_type:complete
MAAAVRLEEFAVDISVVKEFTEEHKKISLRECPNKELGKAKLYNNDVLKERIGDVKYIDRDLIAIGDLAVHTVNGEDAFVNMQVARQAGNSQQSNINTDILECGFDLSQEPIAVRIKKLKNGKEVIEILEGRTRLITLKSKNVKNIIADMYRIPNDADAIRAAQIFNTQKKPFGQVKVADIRHTMNLLLEKDAIDLDKVVINKKMSDKDRQKVSEILKDEVEKISMGRIKPQDKDILINDIIKESSGVEWSRGFNAPSDVLTLLSSKEWNCPNTNDIEYVPITPETAAMVFSTILEILSRSSYDPKRQYRMVNYVSAPKADALETSWTKRTVNIKRLYDEKEKELLQNFFGYSTFKVPPNIQLFGAIPQVKSLHKDCWNEVIRYDQTEWEKTNHIHR